MMSECSSSALMSALASDRVLRPPPRDEFWDAGARSTVSIGRRGTLACCGHTFLDDFELHGTGIGCINEIGDRLLDHEALVDIGFLLTQVVNAFLRGEPTFGKCGYTI